MTFNIKALTGVGKITNSTCIFGSMSGLPPRVGVPVRILNDPKYGLHCASSAKDKKCCCPPITKTWGMTCSQALAYLNKNGLNPKTNQVYSGGVGNRCVSMHFC
tara:strand:+ start:189 stop:500 length:312 start_codon:yes stop_codon:yes gene_type:complete